jgi:dimethylglycine dehydrogenase
MERDRVVGTITSGDWGHRTGLNLAYAFVDPTQAVVGTQMQLDMCGALTPATVIPPCPYDPEFKRMRA